VEVVDLQSLDKPRTPLFGPDGLALDVLSVKEFRASLALRTDQDNTDTSTFETSSCERSDTASTTWTEVDGMSSCGREVASFCPVDWLDKDLVAKRSSQGGADLPQVRA
jgi:hypothetical protein